MPRFAKGHRTLRRLVVLQVAASLAVANCALAANPPANDEAALLAAVDTPLIEKTGKSKPSPAEIQPVEQKSAAATKPAATGEQNEPLPTQTQSSSSKKAWIYGGLGVAAAVAIVAVAAGGGGGSSSSSGDTSSTTPGTGGDNSGAGTDNSGSNTGNGNSAGNGNSGDDKTCQEDTPVNTNPRSPVTNNPSATPVCADLSGKWSGTLDLQGDDGVAVTATVAQDGSSIQITTSSNKKYGKTFIGNIDSNCDFDIWDQTTGEEWSSHFGPATANRIAIYDYVEISCYGYTKYDSLVLTR
ncbi:MAG: hypothetical protein LBU39_05045 [Desulfobulbaceae bacterium]|jgi:hypothetical protein|nr:hypothetical protein [Desulfobulbaceae bacterium]